MPVPIYRHFQAPIPVDQLKKLLVLQLLVQGCRCQLLLFFQPFLVHVSLSKGKSIPSFDLVMLHTIC